MLRLILPAALLVLGTGGGIAAATYLIPSGAPDGGHGADSEAASGVDHGTGQQTDHAVEAAADAPFEGLPPCGVPLETVAAPADGHGGDHGTGAFEYYRLTNQFVVNIIENGRVEALVVASLSIEITAGAREGILEREPQLRGRLLQVLFDHANLGGFNGAFTSEATMRNLRVALKNEARAVLGPIVHDVLITDLVRQENEA